MRSAGRPIGHKKIEPSVVVVINPIDGTGISAVSDGTSLGNSDKLLGKQKRGNKQTADGDQKNNSHALLLIRNQKK